MIVGVPRELKDGEFRVSLTPEGARELVKAGHHVVIEEAAGIGSGNDDHEYQEAGAHVVVSADDVYSRADLILKVKEPITGEYERLREGQLLFTFLHLAADERLTRFLLDRRVTAIAYETVQTDDGRLPLLAPMSEIAGRIVAHVAATYLERPRGGRGVLMGGCPGVAPARVLVLGAGNAGRNAAAIAAGMEADVTVIDRNLDRLREIDQHWRGRIRTVAASSLAIAELVSDSDVVIGAVLVPGARAPRVVEEAMVRSMRAGSVVVDISIDQGGCIDTARVTSHTDPVYTVHDVVHYCVGNIPGAVPRTATYALSNATLPFVLALARDGVQAAEKDPALSSGVNVRSGEIVHPHVADAFGTEPLERPTMASL